MPAPQSSTDHYRQQQQIAAATATTVGKLWEQVGDNFTTDWWQVRDGAIEAVRIGQLAAASTAAQYTPRLLNETGQTAPAAGQIVPAAFTTTAPDGRPVGSLMDETVIHAKTAVRDGATAREALLTAGSWLSGVLLTVIADTGRNVVSADIAQRPLITGYVRMLNTPSCKRCIILAGKWFRWNQGFLRHPRCDCRHIPSSEDRAGDFRTDPYEAFKSLSPREQEKIFGRIEARAIRDGADINRVVNISQRGLGTVKSAAKYGTPSRMTVDDIYRVAGTRTNAIRLMDREGYITGPQIRGGNILGNGPTFEGFGQLGKGGAARAASDAVERARRTGVRDPLNRYTMTAAERRLYDANYKLQVARSGLYPRSVGANSADKFTRPRPITPAELAQFEADYAREISKLPTAPDSVRRLAELLGI